MNDQEKSDIIKMNLLFIGDKNFRKDIRKVLKRYAYVEEQSDKNIITYVSSAGRRGKERKEKTEK